MNEVSSQREDWRLGPEEKKVHHFPVSADESFALAGTVLVLRHGIRVTHKLTTKASQQSAECRDRPQVRAFWIEPLVLQQFHSAHVLCHAVM